MKRTSVPMLENLKEGIEKVLWRGDYLPWELTASGLPSLRIVRSDEEDAYNDRITIEFLKLRWRERLEPYDQEDIKDFKQKLTKAVETLLENTIRRHDKVLMVEDNVMAFRDVVLDYSSSEHSIEWSIGVMMGDYPDVLAKLEKVTGLYTLENFNVELYVNLITDSVDETYICINEIIWETHSNERKEGGKVKIRFDKGFFYDSPFVEESEDAESLMPSLITKVFKTVAKNLFEKHEKQLAPISLIKQIAMADKVEYWTES